MIASEALSAIRKDVLAKCYGKYTFPAYMAPLMCFCSHIAISELVTMIGSGGDISRKKKLLKKQAAGKKRMKAIGRVDVPQ